MSPELRATLTVDPLRVGWPAAVSGLDTGFSGVVFRAGIVLAGALLGGIAIWTLFDRASGNHPGTILPAQGAFPRYPEVDDDVTTLLEGITWRGRRDGDDTRDRLYTELREAARSLLSERPLERSVETALAEGTWTDDPEAAAFFSGNRIPAVSWVESLQGLFGASPPYRRRARRAIKALADLSADRFGPGSGPEDPNWAPFPETTPDPSLTSRLTGVIAIGALGAVLGLVFNRSALVLLGVVPLGLAGYRWFITPPTVDLEITRMIDAADPSPGDEVTVQVGIRNVGDQLLPSLIGVDGVPPGLRVIDGSPRFTTALRPGQHERYSYTVEMTRGDHSFEDPFVIAQDYLAVTERVVRPHTGPDASVRCVPGVTSSSDPPLRDVVRPRTGRGPTAPDAGGLMFHSIREYQPGDPINRVDWQRLARTGELTTVRYEADQRRTVVLAVDGRAVAYTDDGVTGAPLTQHGVVGAYRAATAMINAGYRVGLVAIGPRSGRVTPGAGPRHGRRLRETLSTAPGFAWAPPDAEDEPASQWWDFLQTGTQVLVFSPLLDDEIADRLRWLNATGHEVSVLSHSPVPPESGRGVVALAKRRERVRRLRGAGIPVRDRESNATYQLGDTHA